MTRAIFQYKLRGLAMGLMLGMLIQPANSAELTALKPMNSYHAADNFNANDIAPAIAADANGHMLAVWLYNENDGARDGEYTLKSAVSTTSGTTWADAGQHALVGAFDDNPKLTYLGQGKWIALVKIKVNDTCTEIHALSTHDAGQTWSDPVPLPTANSGDAFRELPEIATDGAGNAIILWRESLPGDPEISEYLTRSTDFGETWSSPQQVTLSSRAGIGREKIAFAGGNKWLLLYRVESDIPDFDPVHGPLTEFRIASSTDLGANWTEIGPVFSNDVLPTAVMVDFKVAGNQAVIAADLPYFQDGYIPPVAGDDPAQIGTAVWTSNDAGTTFTGPMWLRGPAPLETAHNYGNPVFVSADAHGNWIVTLKDAPNPVWSSTDINTTWTLSRNLDDYTGLPAVSATGEGNFIALSSCAEEWNGLFNHDNDIRGFISIDSGQSWEEPFFINQNADSDQATIFDSDVDIAVADSISFAAWTADNSLSVGTVMFSRSYDDGRTWSAAMPLPDAATSNRPRVEWTGGLNFSVYWEDAYQTIYRNDTEDGGLTWADPVDVWHVTMDNPMPWTFWHTPLNPPAIQTSNGETLRVRSVVTPGSNNDSTINTYLDVSIDDGATWNQRALVHSQTKPGTVQPGVTIEGEPAIIDLGQGRLAVMVSNSWIGIPNEQTPPRNSSWDLFLVESVDNGNTWDSGIAVYSGSDGVQFGGSLDPAAFQPVFRAADDRIIMAWALNYDLDRQNDTDIVYRTRQFGETTAAGDWQLFE